MKNLLSWLSGKKTYFLAVLLVLVTVTLIALGKLTPQTSFAVLMFFVAMFAASYRSTLAAHQAQVILVLTTVAALGKDLVSKNSKAAETDALAVAVEGEQLAEQVKAEQALTRNTATSEGVAQS